MESSTYDGWLSISEAASYTHLSQSFLRKMVRSQRIPHARPGGKVLRFRRSELDRWLAAENARPKPKTDATDQPNEVDYARKLLQDLGWPVINGNLDLLTEAVVAEAQKHNCSKARAFDHLRERVLSDRAKGVRITAPYLREVTGQRH